MCDPECKLSSGIFSLENRIIMVRRFIQSEKSLVGHDYYSAGA